MTLSLTLADLAAATDGRIVLGSGTMPVPSISTDSRTINGGQWFLALRGENFDAHQFLPQVLERGAAGLIVAHDVPTTLETGRQIGILVVEDTLRAYGDIAHAWRKRLNPKVACIAGSNGKTTTKEIAATVLAGRKDALCSHGNFNNLIGVPKTLLDMEPHHRIVLAELGMNVRGELERLTTIVQPDVAALTNIGEAHVGMFGSIDALMRAKAELMMAMSAGATLIANADCALSVQAVAQWGTHLRVVWFGSCTHADFCAENIESLKPWGYTFDFVHPLGRKRINVNAYGRHNVANATCAAALLCELGIGISDIAEGISRFRPAAMRSHVLEIGGVTVIEDCYNASPTAMRLAIDSLEDLVAHGQFHIVLGDMLELGEAEQEYHRKLGEHVARLRNARLYATGERARWICDAATLNGMKDIEWFSDAEKLAAALIEKLQPGDIILIKGSRMMKLESVGQALREHLQQV